jgi:DNA-binding YbaB/EbfC family protein
MAMDMKKLMRDLQKVQGEMQQRMLRVQEELGSETVTGSAGGGLVEVELNGHRELVRVSIKPDALKDAQENVENLEDLIYAALNSALTQARELNERKMGEVTGGMDMGALGGAMPLGM